MTYILCRRCGKQIKVDDDVRYEVCLECIGGK
jgi:hypothetical protein